MGLALHTNHDSFQGFPASATFDELGQIRHGWVTPLLPFLDAKQLYNQVRFDRPWYAAENRPVFEQSLPGFIHPALIQDKHDERGYALIHYSGNSLVLQPGRK